MTKSQKIKSVEITTNNPFTISGQLNTMDNVLICDNGEKWLKVDIDSIRVNFESAKIEKSFPLEVLPKSTIEFLLDRGTRKFNDAVNSLFGDQSKKIADYKAQNKEIDFEIKDRKAFVDEVCERILSGWENKTRASSEETAFKAFVLNNLKANKLLTAEQEKSVKGATVKVILQTAYPSYDAERILNGEKLYRQRYEATKTTIEI